MVVFSGVISDEIQSKTMKRRDKEASRVFAIGTVSIIAISGIVYLILFLMDKINSIDDIKELIICSVLLIGVNLLLLWNPRKKLPFKWEFHITIDTDKVVVVCPLWAKPLQKAIKKIKKVFDYGDCYYLIYADLGNSIVCQKDLLAEGTIEEFETIFQGKIIKKPRDKRERLHELSSRFFRRQKQRGQ